MDTEAGGPESSLRPERGPRDMGAAEDARDLSGEARAEPYGEPMKNDEPYAAGTRVHDRGAIYSVGNPDNPGGWGTVTQAVEQHDKTFEYEVAVMRSLAGGESYREPQTTWWGSHHIDRAIAEVKDGAPSG